MFPLSALLISVGAVTALSTVLAILMVIADATIGNYGDVKLTINKDKEYVVRGGRPLLGTLMGEGVFIPSACGGRGSCGLCKVKVLEGAGQYLPTELPWISEEERKENIRLSCQLKIKVDMKIQIPEELFNVREYQSRVASIRDLTHDIKEVTLDLIEPKEINYKAGQFIQFEVPAYDLTPEPVYRAYSMASNPSRTDQVQMEIRLVPEGICTTYVHKYLKEGDKVVFNGPYGDFYMRDTQRDMVCIAGGSGMAPIKSILEDMAHKGNNRKVHYFFGARGKRDLFLLDEMKALEEKLANFTFTPVLSEPEEGDNWTGKTGFVTTIVDEYLTSGENIEAYLCGSPGMIDACLKVLHDKGVPEEMIFFDKFS